MFLTKPGLWSRGPFGVAMRAEKVRHLIRQEELLALAGERAANLYHVRGLCCSEAVILVLAKGFGASMSEESALSIGAGFCGGMGGGEGVCGALSGSVVGLGTHLAPNLKKGLSKGKMRQTASLVHDAFKNKYGSTRCKDLTEKFAGDKKAKLQNCGKITADTAVLAVELLLQQAPALARKADLEFLRERETRVSRLLKKVRGKRD
jgi:C_GCAxxG_C_C family probable redox protein